jgi:Heterokaryon incompatibility protein (HET)
MQSLTCQQIMRLVQIDANNDFSLTDDLLTAIPTYAILSHTWGPDEVTYNDILAGNGRNKLGYQKILFCVQQTVRDGLQHFWVDTCCIDKSNSVELQEAINSMFRWYQNAATCYVYLSDVSTEPWQSQELTANSSSWSSAFQQSRWFQRGWTLQELLAPRSVEFFSREHQRFGDKKSMERLIHEITTIPIQALQGAPLAQFGVDERFSWIQSRQTTRQEDLVYSLLGIFNVYMPLIYGEGRDNAFKRLKEEVKKHARGENENATPEQGQAAVRQRLSAIESSIVELNGMLVDKSQPGSKRLRRLSWFRC